MDMFDVLKVLMKRKAEIMYKGLSEREALTKARLLVSKEYHISIFDIERLYA
jgi:hypothetical protein